MASQPTLPVSKLIQVTVTLTASAAQGPNLNSCMIVGDSTVIDIATRYRFYANLSEVASDFGTTAPEYFGAAAFFGQNPSPPSVYIGRWVKTASAGQLWGGPLVGSAALISNFTAITAGAFLYYEDGVPYAVTGLNFSAATNLNGVATDLQTALSALEASTTVVWNGNYDQFVFTSGTTGASSSVSFLALSASVGSAAFSGNPTAADTLTLGGTSIEFVASGASGNEVNIGGTLAATLTSLATLINGSADVNLSKISATVVGSTIYFVYKTAGTAGNVYTLARSSSAITLSGADLAGGVADTTTPGILGGLKTSSGAYVANGIATESAVAAVQAIEAQFANWYGLNFAAGANNADVADSDYLAVAAYIEGDSNRHLFGLTTSEGAALLSSDSSSIGYQLKQLGYQRTFYQWSSQNPYASLSLLGLGCTVNFNGSNTTINFAWQSEPGVAAENLNSGQAAALDANHYNYFANFNNGAAITVNGYVANGHYIDEIWNADWFGSTIQTACFDLLQTVRTKIPQTDPGMNQIAVTIESVCEQGVTNGFLAPGTWQSSGFGNISEGTFLPKGYYIYEPPIASQSQADRAARKSVAFQVAAKEAGAVNDIAVNVIVNQ